MSRLSIGVYAPMNMSRFAGDSVRIMELLSGLRSLGVEATAIIPEGGNPSVSSRFEPALKFRIPSSSNPFLNYAFCSLLTQYLVPQSIFDGSFDLVQVEGSYALPLSKIRKLASRRNIVFDMHSIPALDVGPYVPANVSRFLSSILHSCQDFLCLNSHCLVVSHSMKRYIHARLGSSLENIHVIPNGVNLETATHHIAELGPIYEKYRDGTELLLCYVGGLEWYEGVDILIAAVAEVRKRVPTVKLVIAGNGTQESLLKSLVVQYGLQDCIKFIGWIPYEETFALQSVADILLAPRKPLSQSGIDISTPMKIPSYLSSGRPIVASNIGEIPHIARHMREAILVDWIAPEMYAKAIEILHNDAKLMANMAGQCAIRANDYSWKTICGNLLQLYQELLDYG